MTKIVNLALAAISLPSFPAHAALPGNATAGTSGAGYTKDSIPVSPWKCGGPSTAVVYKPSDTSSVLKPWMERVPSNLLTVSGTMFIYAENY